MTVVQRVQEAGFGDPSPFLDDDAMHDGDLSGRAAEAEQGDAQPDLERLAKADAMRRHRPVRRDAGTGLVLAALMRARRHGVGQLWVSPTASRAQR